MNNKWMSMLTKEIGKAADDLPNPSDHVVKFPSPSLNWLVGNGGITRGKALCLYGSESSGKSFLAQLLMIQLQKDFPEGICIWCDTEFSFQKNWFIKLGGDPKRLVVRQSNTPESIFDYIGGELNQMIQDGCPVVGIVIDSVRAIRFPKDMRDKTTKMIQGGSGAPYLGSAFKLILPVIRATDITTVLVQQVSMEMDEYKKMNNPYVVPDGFALKHFSDYMLEVTRLDTKDGRIEEGKTMSGSAQQVGHKVRVRGKKNRVGAPYRTAEFTIKYASGIVDTEEEIYNLAKSLGIVKHPLNPDTGKANPQMWQVGSHTPIRGEENFKQWFTSSPRVLEEALAECNNTSDSVVQPNADIGIVDIDLGAPEL